MWHYLTASDYGHSSSLFEVAVVVAHDFLCAMYTCASWLLSVAGRWFSPLTRLMIP